MGMFFEENETFFNSFMIFRQKLKKQDLFQFQHQHFLLPKVTELDLSGSQHVAIEILVKLLKACNTTIQTLNLKRLNLDFTPYYLCDFKMPKLSRRKRKHH